MGIALMPWRLLANYRTFILGWLGGYAAFLGPVAGIMICDYFVIRRRVLRVDDLYLRGGIYEYSRGFNWGAVAALALGAGTALSGLAIPSLRVLYDYSWFVGFAVSFVANPPPRRTQPMKAYPENAGTRRGGSLRHLWRALAN